MANWIMPEWMSIYENLITNQAGFSLEKHMNDQAKQTGTTGFVKSQVILLENLHKMGLLKEDISEN